ncbi:MAG: HD domain-containing protein [Acidobacteria bacterium]|nr:HD domain-containing protein [Acidobacteriota bacterium]MCW5948182.1 HD domain-containing protein [Pyrinomonadaceae bacterium]
MGRSGSERVYRDSVHNIIRIDTTTDEGRLLTALIDTPEFQRLRRVRQLGLAFFAYQAAEHSRFTHSLGALHLATRIIERLRTRYPIDDEQCTAVRVAALLHDVGHGAFSHVIESILGFHHEDFSIAAVTSSATEINRVLSMHSERLADDVASIIRGDFRPRALAQLVSSQLDVDRMDYLLRDSLMTGAKYGIYDVEWIIRSIEINEADDHLYVSAPGVYAVEDYLQARYYMFRQVYFHRTLRAAETVLRSLLKRALRLYSSGGDVWFRPGTPFERILAGGQLNLGEHLATDDSDVIFHIKQWVGSTDAVLSDLSSRFLDRRLFKAYDLDMPEAERERFMSDARREVEKAGFDPEHYFIEDSAGNAEGHFYTQGGSDPKNLIYVEDGFAKPAIREISEVSSAVRGLQAGYRVHRVCFPAEIKHVIERLYHGS